MGQGHRATAPRYPTSLMVYSSASFAAIRFGTARVGPAPSCPRLTLPLGAYMTAPAAPAPVTHHLRPRRLPPRPRHPRRPRRPRRRRQARRPRRRPRLPRCPRRPRRRPRRRRPARGLLLSVRASARTAGAESCGPILGAASIRWKSADRPARRPPTARASPTPRLPQTQEITLVVKPPGLAAACCL